MSTKKLVMVALIGLAGVECFVSVNRICGFNCVFRRDNFETKRGIHECKKSLLQAIPNSLMDGSMVPVSHAFPFPGSAGTLIAAGTASLARAVQLGGIPAAGMLVVTGIGLKVKTPPTVIGALQHAAAGILLTTVAKELLPEMVKAEGLLENLASAFGFFAGVGVLILLGILLPEEEQQREDTTKPEATKPAPSLRNRRLSKKKAAFQTGSMPYKPTINREMGMIDDEMRSGWETIDSKSSQESAISFPEEFESHTVAQGDGSSPRSSFALPIALIAAVCIDSALDGLLVGTSTALDPTTSSILSASLTVESSFLGLTIATAIRSCPAPSEMKIVGSALAPTSLLFGSFVGGSLAPMVAESPALLAGLLGFGTSATLFMVVEELLLQAHEDGAEHVWWVDAQLYVGFYASVMLDKFLGI